MNIQDYFEFIIKKQGTLTENLPVQIYPNKIKYRIVFRFINSWNNEIVRKYKKGVDKDKDSKNVPKLESVEVVLVNCNLVKKKICNRGFDWKLNSW